MRIHVKRIYEQPSAEDGVRILVDRIWPRGLTKASAKLDFWFKDLAPSTTLRKWFNHDAQKWLEFRERYFIELSTKPDLISQLKSIIQTHKVTLVFAAKQEIFNNAEALKSYLEQDINR